MFLYNDSLQKKVYFSYATLFYIEYKTVEMQMLFDFLMWCYARFKSPILQTSPELRKCSEIVIITPA